MLMLTWIVNNTWAQIFVNGKDLNLEPDLEYIELIVDRRAFNQGQVFAIIDHGQVIRAFTWRQHRIKDDKGNDKRFNSEMDIFNFLNRNGWLHDITYSTEAMVYHIFRRKKIIGGEK